MKLTLESTTRMVEVDGVKGRVWEGRSAEGVRCYAVITRIMVLEQDDFSVFQRELDECKAPSDVAVKGVPTPDDAVRITRLMRQRAFEAALKVEARQAGHKTIEAYERIHYGGPETEDGRQFRAWTRQIVNAALDAAFREVKA